MASSTCGKGARTVSGIDPRLIELRREHNREQQRLSDEFFASRPDLDPCDDGPTGWTYEDRMAMNAFFAEARARWLREGAALHDRIDAENTHASA